MTRWEKKFSSHDDFREHLENMNFRSPRTRTQIKVFHVSWPRIYTGTQMRSSLVCANADVVMSTCADSSKVPSCSILVFFAIVLFHYITEPKFKK